MKLMSENLGYEPRVIATGGLAPLVVPYAKTVTDMNLELTLEGLRMIAENNFKEKPGDKDKSL
ncbi:MAG: hypothetical protein LUB61_06210 [Eggerthellaceae bacterium]|nr:hypothetical protein [Eggerthellaceae bacterium]